jgi:peptidylprolyl isomerase
MKYPARADAQDVMRYAVKEILLSMPKTTTKKSSARQVERIRQAHATPVVRPNDAVRRAAQKRQQPTGLSGFVRTFPWATGILSVAILAGFFTILSANHLTPLFALPPDLCAWAKHSSSPAPAGATIQRSYATPPRSCITITTGGEYDAIIHTSQGNITVILDQTQSPITVNNFVFLAAHHFYDGLNFFQQTGYAIKGGDPRSLTGKQVDFTKPVADHSDGPGYYIPDELPTSATIYTPQSVVMDNEGATSTSGSRFFIMTSTTTTLKAAYNYFGRVTDSSFATVKKLVANDKILAITINYNAKGTPGGPVVTPTP